MVKIDTRFKCFDEAHVKGENEWEACDTQIQAPPPSVRNPGASPSSPSFLFPSKSSALLSLVHPMSNLRGADGEGTSQTKLVQRGTVRMGRTRVEVFGKNLVPTTILFLPFLDCAAQPMLAPHPTPIPFSLYQTHSPSSLQTKSAAARSGAATNTPSTACRNISSSLLLFFPLLLIPSLV